MSLDWGAGQESTCLIALYKILLALLPIPSYIPIAKETAEAVTLVLPHQLVEIYPALSDECVNDPQHE